MEEDIKKFKAYLAVLNEENIIYRKEDAIKGLLILYENLISRNKELEKIVDTLNYGIKNHFIPKSKIKEKIKELNEDMLNENESIEHFYKLKFCYEVLQELIKE